MRRFKQLLRRRPINWALRAYGTEPQVWGGDPECRHHWIVTARLPQSGGDGTASAKQVSNAGSQLAKELGHVGECQKCGAWRGELGHEPTPQMFCAHLVDVFREVRRVLKDDGVCFVNLGDSYSGSGKGPTGHNGIGDQDRRQGVDKSDSNRGSRKYNLPGGVVPDGIPAKSLVLIPERFALAMQDDGWIVRSRIAWCKRAPMPESVRDRPTNAWEHIWMFSKSQRYFWDAEAVREPDAGYRSGNGMAGRQGGSRDALVSGGIGSVVKFEPGSGRNMWSYWLLSPDPEPLAHFATFPREIPKRCILAATRPGDVVLDPFNGSGTTTMVARSLGRRGIGIELNEIYLRDIALKKNAQMALMEAGA